MIRLDPDSSAPVFEQVVQQVVANIADGSFPPGHRLPSVRQLAVELGLAPNTVAKSYKRLEELGYVRTQGRGGTVVSAGSADPVEDALRVATAEFLAAAQAMGLSLDEALARVRERWRGAPTA